MENVKFRVWDSQFNAWVDPDDVRMNCSNGQIHGKHSCGNVPAWVLEQFTGRTDKNGVEIYAGDIMHDPEDDENPYQVVWCEQSAQWQTHCEESESCSVFEMSGPLVEFAPSDVVIGNIHQHADLLKGE